MQLTRNQQDALNIKKHVCVTAGAGSGKTTVLVQRYLKILRKGKTTPRQIVAITFTEKAAAEMKERIIEEMSEEVENADVEHSNSLQRFRDEMNSAHISTIHAFCSSILREFPFQADVPANFSIVSGIDQKLLLQDTLKETLKNIATTEEDKHRPELTRLLQRYGGQKNLVDFFSIMVEKRDVLERLMNKMYSNSNDTEIRQDLEQQVRKQLLSTIGRLMSKIDVTEFIRCLNTVLEVARGRNAEDAKNLTPQLEEQHEQNPEALEVLNLLRQIATLITTGENEIRTRSFLPKSIDRTGIADQIDFLESTAKKIKGVPILEKEKDGNKKADIETDDDFLISTTRALLTLYKRILTDYQNAKLSQGTLDFSDLQLKTRDLFYNNEEIRQELIKRYKYFMIDEYQDTNELQYELVMLLTNKLKCANLFIVGDPKQSIYAFRGADVRVFEKTKQKIIAECGLDISLTENFRSLRDPIGFINYLFDHLMGDGSENEFEVPYESLIKARRTDADGAVEILLGQNGKGNVDEYALITNHIKNMKHNGDTVWVRDENRREVERPIEYGDIAILIRSRTHLPNIEHALLEASIPYLTTGGIGFYQRQEIYDIWNYLNFLNTPEENQTSLGGILRSPAFAISDTELYEISLQEGADFWHKVRNYQAPSEHLRNAIDTLKKHIEIAQRTPVNQLIGTIVNQTGMIGTLKTGKQGDQRWANYQKLLDLARNFDGDENRQTLPDFIEFLHILITEEPREGQAPVEASSKAVQIMTIHAAKGKEFPIVILPCLNRKGQTDSEPFIDETFGIGFSPLKPDDKYRKTEPSIIAHMKNRSSEKEVAEKKRLFYVGTTRAEDRLILSGTLSEKGEAQQMLKWLDTHLGICGPEDDLPSLPFKLNVFRQLEDKTPTDEILLDDITPFDFSEWLPSTLEPTSISAAFSVTELANYARCPLRYQLENVLRIPTNKQEEGDSDKDELDNAIRYTFTRIRRQSDTDNLDTIINQTAENYSEVTSNLTTLLHTSANNFINSELGETALSASETHTNQQVHADIEGHIIDGRFDRLLKDETQHWQVINYKTDDAQDSDVYDPEMELYSMLLHRRYPQQPTVTMNLFFPEQDRYIQKRFNVAELQEAKEKWKKKISDLQQGKYNRNLDHCRLCPYADSDRKCIITEGEEE
ncbi:UvrD-helicase domain-containing protein [Candidatus Poribacteria bacterium]|nr:UvrD-helicase domain-containing protein [Candidatus Poribacteria bacterium]